MKNKIEESKKTPQDFDNKECLLLDSRPRRVRDNKLELSNLLHVTGNLAALPGRRHINLSNLKDVLLFKGAGKSKRHFLSLEKDPLPRGYRTTDLVIHVRVRHF